MTLRFVPFELAMADALVPMWRESFEYGVGIVDPHPIGGQRAHLIERVLPEHDVTVALEGDRIVGFVAVASGSEPIWQLDDVRYEWQRTPNAGARIQLA